MRTAIHALARMQHRGAILADGKTGDGCGLLLQKPDRFFRIVAQERGWRLAKNYAVGMLFLNKDPELAATARRIVEEELQRETLSIVGWRDVPTNEGVLGETTVIPLKGFIVQHIVNLPQALREPHFRTAAHGHSKSVATGFACHTRASHSPPCCPFRIG